MAEQQKFYTHLSSLIAKARLEKGYATLKELYRDRKPDIDYQTWLNAESGRRIPSAVVVTTIAKNLEIDRQSIILAYCKDKFRDEESQTALDTLRLNKFVDVDTLLDAEQHNRSKEYVFSAEEMIAMKKDIRLRLFLTYTYDNDLNTSVSKLVQFFGEPEEEVREVVAQLEKLKLIEANGDNIKKIHRHTCISKSNDNFEFRKLLLIKSLERTVQQNSYLTNFHISMTEESYRKILAFFDFVGANLIKLDKEDSNKENASRFQIAITGNRLTKEKVNNGYEE